MPTSIWYHDVPLLSHPSLIARQFALEVTEMRKGRLLSAGQESHLTGYKLPVKMSSFETEDEDDDEDNVDPGRRITVTPDDDGGRVVNHLSS
jgi:hypothetical protein